MMLVNMAYLNSVSASESEFDEMNKIYDHERSQRIYKIVVFLNTKVIQQ